MQKPFSPEGLAAKIEELLRRLAVLEESTVRGVVAEIVEHCFPERLEDRIGHGAPVRPSSRISRRVVSKYAERSYGSFTRSFTLANTVNSEAIKAAYENGVLTLTIPKREEAKPKQIKINVGTQAMAAAAAK